MRCSKLSGVRHPRGIRVDRPPSARCGWRIRLRSRRPSVESDHSRSSPGSCRSESTSRCRSYSNSIRPASPRSSASSGGPLQRLNARHLDADGLGILVPLQRRAPRGRCSTDRLDLLLKLLRVLRGGVQPIPALVGLQGGRAEEAAHLGRRDRRDDAPLDDLVGQFVGRPVGDGPARLLGARRRPRGSG